MPNIFVKPHATFDKERGGTVGHEVPRISDRGFESDGFELCVGQGVHLSGGHVRLEHQAFYTLRLFNHRSTRCNASVLIDGKEVGVWRIEPHSIIELERPVGDVGRFTFYRLGSAGAAAAGLVASEQTGLITVVFIPERTVSCNEGSPMFSRRHGDARGGTGLSGLSGQRYVSAERIDLDLGSSVTIYARLIAHELSARSLSSLGSVVPSPLP
jgi:hypothetical protein